MRLSALETHAAGEPTRIITAGFPDLGRGPIAERRLKLAKEFDHLRRGIILEPRGSDVLVGALLQEPSDPTCDAGVIFFNNAGVLNMCGHGTMCVVRALDYLGRKPRGEAYRLETPVGVVEAKITEVGWIEVENVPSYRKAKGVAVPVGGGTITGDIAWGGNWFYIAEDSPIEVCQANLRTLCNATEQIRHWLNGNGYPEVDHVELCQGRRNYVLCPGAAYDRSPCGTGTSAHMACLFEEGHLKEGEEWIQESVIGSLFRGRIRSEGESLIPTISGQAYVTGELTLILGDDDPFQFGI